MSMALKTIFLVCLGLLLLINSIDGFPRFSEYMEKDVDNSLRSDLLKRLLNEEIYARNRLTAAENVKRKVCNTNEVYVLLKCVPKNKLKTN